MTKEEIIFINNYEDEEITFNTSQLPEIRCINNKAPLFEERGSYECNPIHQWKLLLWDVCSAPNRMPAIAFCTVCGKVEGGWAKHE